MRSGIGRIRLKWMPALFCLEDLDFSLVGLTVNGDPKLIRSPCSPSHAKIVGGLNADSPLLRPWTYNLVAAAPRGSTELGHCDPGRQPRRRRCRPACRQGFRCFPVDRQDRRSESIPALHPATLSIPTTHLVRRAEVPGSASLQQASRPCVPIRVDDRAPSAGGCASTENRQPISRSNDRQD